MDVTRENLPTRAVIYCRVSDPKQAEADRTSFPVQEQQCRDFISQNGLTYAAGMSESVSAYRNLHDRELKTFIRKNRNSTLVVYSVDRLSRNYRDGMEIVAIARQARVAICFAADGFILNSANRTRFERMLQSAEDWSREHGRRVSAGKKLTRERGYYAGGPLPFGYTSQQETGGKRLVADPDEQPVITFIGYALRKSNNRNVTTKRLNELMAEIVGAFEMRASPIQCYDEDGHPIARLTDNMSNQDVADLLNEYNVRRRGNRWTAYAVGSVWNRHDSIQNDPNNLANLLDTMTVDTNSNKRSRRTPVTANRARRGGVPIPVAPQGMFEFSEDNVNDLPSNVPYVAVRNPNYDSDEYVDDNMDSE